MAKPKNVHHPHQKVIATVTAAQGACHWGHEVGDTFEISCHDTAGLCGFFYHDIFPYLLMLEFGGAYPPTWGDPDVVTVKCTDAKNPVTMELRRVKP